MNKDWLDPNTILLKNSDFIRNAANIGSVFKSFGDLVISHENCKFENNVAKYGGDFSARPEKLRLRVYQVSEVFIFLSDVSIPNMIKSQDTVSYFINL